MGRLVLGGFRLPLGLAFQPDRLEVIHLSPLNVEIVALFSIKKTYGIIV